MTRVAQDFLFLVLMNVLLVGICSAAARFPSDGVIIFYGNMILSRLRLASLDSQVLIFVFNLFRMGKYNPVPSCYCFKLLMTNEMRIFFIIPISSFFEATLLLSWHRRMILGNNLSLSHDG